MTRAVARCLFPLLLAVMGVLAGPAARAQAVSAGDAASVRGVVEAQLAAFAADDAKRAFSYAAPAIREMFGDAERFMVMVRGGYPVVYRPATVTFLKPAWVQGQLVQGVQLSDDGGALWLAVYRLERQADASWRIAGCEVQASAGTMT